MTIASALWSLSCRSKKLSRAESGEVESVLGEAESPAMSRRTVNLSSSSSLIISQGGGRRQGLGLSNGPVTSSVSSSRAREPRRPARSSVLVEQEVGRYKIDMWRILLRSGEVYWLEMNLFDI